MPDVPLTNLQRPINRIMKIPFQMATDGSVAFVTDAYEIAGQYLRMMILTRFKERVMRPLYGTRAIDSVFEPNDATLDMLLMSDITDVVAREEPSIRVDRVWVEPTPGDPTLIVIYVSYQLTSVDAETQVVTLEVSQVVPSTRVV